MPHIYKIDPKKKLILMIFSGDITVDEIKYVLMEVSLHPDFNSDYDSYSDMLNCVFLFDSEEQDELVGLFKFVFDGGSGRSAVLLHDSEVASTAKSHAVQVKEVREMRVYDNHEDALSWLDLDAEDVQVEHLPLVSYPL